MGVLWMNKFFVVCADYDPSYVSPLYYLQNILPFALFVIWLATVKPVLHFM
jgi:hypothetical protein